MSMIKIMNKLLTILMILGVVFLYGCSVPTTIDNKPNVKITYFKDEAHNLCFGQMGSQTKDGFIVASITEVPCEKVEKDLIK